MKAWAASVEEVFREASARWTLLAYFALSSLFILLFALAVNLDIVNGALAGARLFGRAVDLGGEKIDMDRLVLGFETGFSGFLYMLGTFLALFATAHLVPRLLGSRRVLAADVDHASADRLDPEAGTPVVGAEVFDQGVVVYANQHGIERWSDETQGANPPPGSPDCARCRPLSPHWSEAPSSESSGPRRIGARGS